MTTAVFIDDGGRENPRNGYDEERVWFVTPGDDDGEPTGPSVTCTTKEVAIETADELSKKYGGVEVVEL